MDNSNLPRKPDYDEPQLPIKEATPGHIALAATKGVKTIALQIGYKRLQVSFQILCACFHRFIDVFFESHFFQKYYTRSMKGVFLIYGQCSFEFFMFK